MLAQLIFISESKENVELFLYTEKQTSFSFRFTISKIKYIYFESYCYKLLEQNQKIKGLSDSQINLRYISHEKKASNTALIVK